MRIGLNLIFLVPGETGGMEVYARALIPALLAAEPGLELTTFLSREAAARDGPWHGLTRTVTVPVDARRRVQWVRGEQQLLPRLAARAGVELVHSLASTGPGRGPFCRVVTIHDLIYRVYPEAHPGIRRLGMRLLVPLAARRAHRVIAISNSTRDDVMRLLRVPADRIDVVYQGAGSVSAATPTPQAALRKSLDLGTRRVVLSVSAKRPHKNLVRLLDALAAIPAERRPVLVLPGYPTWHEAELRRHAEALDVDACVRFLGWVSEPDLEGLYALADCFAFPSLYEGFGLPVLEAMARGVPVVCSDRSSLPEVAGDAARYFDPDHAGAIAEAIETVLSGGTEARRLRTAGLERVRAFTWERTARGTLASYEQAIT